MSDMSYLKIFPRFFKWKLDSNKINSLVQNLRKKYIYIDKKYHKKPAELDGDRIGRV